MTAMTANNSKLPEKRVHPLSLRLYGFLLLAYPLSFRREYAPHMAQVFRDCYRGEKINRGLPGVCRLILRTLLDLARTAPKEHLENLGKDNSVMNTLRKDALALIGCLGIIVVAFCLLSYGRKHEVPSILIFGYALDALVTAGIVGNLIVFVLVKTTRLNPLRTALWTLLIVNGVLLLVTVIIGVPPAVSLYKKLAELAPTPIVTLVMFAVSPVLRKTPVLALLLRLTVRVLPL